MQLKVSRQKPRTLRGNIRPTPASLHLEITMLLHHERRCRLELEVLRAREQELQAQIRGNRERVRSLRDLSDRLDPGSSQDSLDLLSRDARASSHQGDGAGGGTGCEHGKKETGVMEIEY